MKKCKNAAAHVSKGSAEQKRLFSVESSCAAMKENSSCPGAEEIIPNKSRLTLIINNDSLSEKSHVVEVVKHSSSSQWEWIELLRDKNPHFIQRTFHRRTIHRNEEIVQAFGTSTPHCGDVLLHYAGDPPTGTTHQPYPLLLVHGANTNADFWLDPLNDGSYRGLPQYLKAQGFSVFAVTFAHSQDDNLVWAQQTANAIDRIVKVTGVDRVDLLGHSKGGVPVRCYVSNFREPWMTPYRGDVRRLILIAAPNGGVDFTFRHPVCNYALYEGGDSHRMNAPMSWDSIMRFGTLHDCRAMGHSKDGPDYWPGQRQLLARWDHVHPLPSLEPDGESTYQGGSGLISESRGIDYFIGEGGNFMERLGKASIDDGVEVVVLAGNRASIKGIMNEKSGPSDGILFVSSALALPAGTAIIAEEVLPLNHITLVADRRAKDWLCGVLKSSERHPLSSEELGEVKLRALGFDRGLDEERPSLSTDLINVLIDGTELLSELGENVSRKTSASDEVSESDEPQLSYEVRDLPELNRDSLPEFLHINETAVPLL